MNKQIRNIGLLVVVLASMMAFSGAAYAIGPGGDGPDGEGVGPVGNVGAPSQNPEVDPDYDDLWTTDFPQTIGGFNVGYVNTPKDRACISIPIIYLQAPQASLEEFLASQHDISSLNAAIQSVPGVPAEVRLSFSPGLIDRETAAAEDAIWNRERSENGCLPIMADMEDPNSGTPDRGFAIFQNTDAGGNTHDHGHSVKIRSPSGIGTGQDLWSSALINVLTDTDHFLQSGMIMREGLGQSRMIWAESDGVQPPGSHPFKKVPYLAGSLYQFQIIYSGGSWMMCAGIDQNIAKYQCMTSVLATGTHLKRDINTSVFFENANANSNWYSGFPAAITVSHAKTMRNGVYRNWTTEDRRTAHRCPGSQYPVPGAMSSTLKNNGTAYWLMSGIPLACP